MSADTTDVILEEPETRQNVYDKENETPVREESPSVLVNLEETLAAMSPMIDSQVSTSLEALPVDMPPMLDVLVNTVLQEKPTEPTPVLSPHVLTITPPMLDPQPSTSFEITPKDLLPIPKALPKIKQNNRKRSRTAILTSSPYKKELEEEKLQQEQKKTPKRVAKDDNTAKSAKKFKTKMKKYVNDANVDLDDDPECFYCGEVWSKSRQEDGWIQCSVCKRWAHKACSGCDDEDDIFCCEFCL